MRLTLRQSPLLGRFHATTWRRSPYDDPYFEWPPSPWRLLRALIARSYQLERENGVVGDGERQLLISAFATSKICWRLPEASWRGPILQQYHPYGKAGRTTKVRDNFWALGEAAYWLLDGKGWDEAANLLLRDCLNRLIYFGRAESLGQIEVVGESPEPNCVLSEEKGTGLVPTLCPMPGVNLKQLTATSDELKSITIPPGSRWLYASRPAAVPRVRPTTRVVERRPTSLVQFGLAGRVMPTPKDTVVLTQRFRGRALRHWLDLASGGECKEWSRASEDLRVQASWLSGKDELGQPLADHSQATVFLDDRGGGELRLCVWRREPIHHLEQRALSLAAARPLPLNAVGGISDWSVVMIPLASTDTPAALQAQPARRWRCSAFVPPRHALDRRGRPRLGEAIDDQVRAELARRGLNPERASVAFGPAGWVRVHAPRNGTKRSYWVELSFADPVEGPIFLGMSSHFGLGQFLPLG